MSTKPDGLLEELQGGVAWTAPDGTRTHYYHRETSCYFSLEVRELRRFQRFDCRYDQGEEQDLDKPRREFCGKASLGRATDFIELLRNPEARRTLELIGKPETKSHDVSVRLLEGIEPNKRIADQHRSAFDPSSPVLVTHCEDAGWEISIPLSPNQFDALSEAYDNKEIEALYAGLSSYMLFITDPYREHPHDNFYMAPWPFKATTHLGLDYNFTAGDDGYGSIWADLRYFHIISKEACLTLAPPVQGTGASEQYLELPETMRNSIEREIDAQFEPLEGADKIATYTRRKKVWLTRQLAYGYAHRLARYGLNQANEFNLRLKDALAFLEEIQEDLNPLSSEAPDSQRANEQRNRLTEFEQTCDPKSWVWMHMDANSEIQASKALPDPWRYSEIPLTDLIFAYFRKPWLENPAIEFIMADALIFRSTLDFGIQINKINSWNTRGLSVGCVLVGLAVAYFQGLWLGILVGALCGGFGKIYHYFQNRNSEKLLGEMISVSNLFSDARISPEFVKQRLLATAERGAVWPVGAIALVEHAAKRNPVTWVN